MKKETYHFVKFDKLRLFLENEIRVKDIKFAPDGIQFDDIYEGDLLYYLKKTFVLLNHMGEYSYEGVYHGKTGWLIINKIKRKKKSLKIIIDYLSKDIEFNLSGK